MTLIKGALPQTRVQQTSQIYEYTPLEQRGVAIAFMAAADRLPMSLWSLL